MKRTPTPKFTVNPLHRKASRISVGGLLPAITDLLRVLQVLCSNTYVFQSIVYLHLYLLDLTWIFLTVGRKDLSDSHFRQLIKSGLQMESGRILMQGSSWLCSLVRTRKIKCICIYCENHPLLPSFFVLGRTVPWLLFRPVYKRDHSLSRLPGHSMAFVDFMKTHFIKLVQGACIFHRWQ